MRHWSHNASILCYLLCMLPSFRAWSCGLHGAGRTADWLGCTLPMGCSRFDEMDDSNSSAAQRSPTTCSTMMASSSVEMRDDNDDDAQLDYDGLYGDEAMHTAFDVQTSTIMQLADANSSLAHDLEELRQACIARALVFALQCNSQGMAMTGARAQPRAYCAGEAGRGAAASPRTWCGAGADSIRAIGCPRKCRGSTPHICTGRPDT